MASKKNENTKKAHQLLAVYWFITALGSGNIPKATLSVLEIEKNSRKKEYLERHSAPKNSGIRNVLTASAAGSAGKKGSGATAATHGKARKVRSGPVNRSVFRSWLKYILKKERLF